MKKRGRPRVEDPRTNQYRLRLNEAENELMKEACELTGMSLSDVLREGVRRIVVEERAKGFCGDGPGVDFDGEEVN